MLDPRTKGSAGYDDDRGGFVQFRVELSAPGSRKATQPERAARHWFGQPARGGLRVSANWRTRRRPAAIASVLLAIGSVLTVAAAATPPAAAQSAARPSYVKYYIVRSMFDGKPETLAEIAARFLGSASRYTAIFDLNKDVPQPGGGELTNPAVIEPGWVLVLPWDAVGPGVLYGLRPNVPQAPAPAPAQPARAKPAYARPECAAAHRSSSVPPGDWGVLRVAPQEAWPFSRGAGVAVAIVDSGVDASAHGLAGRVAAGYDIAGKGRGNTDCLGSGTAMAGIVAAGSAAPASAVGVAPAATIVPVRIATTKTAVSVANQVRAIRLAVSARAKVIALGGYVNPAAPAVAGAIAAAARHDLVVVAGAPVRSSGKWTASGNASTTLGVIWVGAINFDGALAAHYRPGAVNVVAPGVDVSSLGITGTRQSEVSGPQYAVAFVAGEVALVRARYPDLTAAQVVQRIETTAERMGSSAPDSAFGWGLIDPVAAVTAGAAFGRSPSNRPAITPRPARASSPLRTRAVVIALGLALIFLLLVILRVRSMVRPATGKPPADAPPGRPAAEDDLPVRASSLIRTTSAETASTSWAGAGSPGAGLPGASFADTDSAPLASVSPWAVGGAGHDQAGGWADAAQWGRES
jgi:membrane-anchored mycosin MYCP